MSGDFIGSLELFILLAVLDLEPEAFGSEIRRVLQERGGRSVSLGAIYSTLRRLDRKGLVSVVEAPSPKGGRPRRYARVTPKGLEAVRRMHGSLQEMSDRVHHRLVDGES